jgi:hypothetical protein
MLKLQSLEVFEKKLSHLDSDMEERPGCGGLYRQLDPQVTRGEVLLIDRQCLKTKKPCSHWSLQSAHWLQAKCTFHWSPKLCSHWSTALVSQFYQLRYYNDF